MSYASNASNVFSVFSPRNAQSGVPIRRAETFRGCTDMLSPQPGYNLNVSRNRNNNGSRVCTLRNPDSAETLFETMDACQSNASCAFSYQCPENENEQPVEVANSLGQTDPTKVGCYECIDGASKFQSKALGHYNVDSSSTNCGATLPLLSPTYLKTTPVTGSNTDIGGYQLTKLGSVIARGTQMSVNASFTITLNLTSNKQEVASGDDSLLASIIVVDSTKWNPPTITSSDLQIPQLFSNVPFTGLTNDGGVVAGYLFDASNKIETQKNNPGVSFVQRDSLTHTVNITAANVPVVNDRVYDVYGYLALATDDSITWGMNQTAPSFYFNSQKYTYVCALTPGEPPVRYIGRNDGKVLSNLVGCYACTTDNGACYFNDNGPGDKLTDSNCNGLCPGIITTIPAIDTDRTLKAVTPGGTECNTNSNSLDYMGLVFIRSYVARATKMNVRAQMTISVDAGSGDDVVMAAFNVLDTTDYSFIDSIPYVNPVNTVTGINVWGLGSTTGVNKLLGPLQEKYVAGPKFNSTQCNATNNNSGVTRIVRGQSNIVVLFNQDNIPVVIGRKYGVYGVFGIGTDDPIHIKNVQVNTFYHF